MNINKIAWSDPVRPVRPKDPLLRSAWYEAKILARMIRGRILMGVLVYGKTLVEREFLLRRITTLSLYLFAVLAILSKSRDVQNSGSDAAGERRLLALFLEESREMRRALRRFSDSRLEKGWSGPNDFFY
ncbi:MAG: hypothetical protein EHM45_19670 [Desulfobacteraceae bacterium]|nr:MAG: hypothetical protein EHM45_19670 [Desulfobacteraceae bacterium]